MFFFKMNGMNKIKSEEEHKKALTNEAMSTTQP
jgi:hypothetical protein